MSIESKNTHFEDFVGFTFDGTHSSDLNLYRVNDGGNRYTWDMVPAFQDKTVQVGGRDGTYYFGSNYQKRDIQISVAFDNVGEEEFNKIRTWGADKKIHKLIFDETPYKYYNVKLSKSPQLKYVCFDESENFMRDDEPIERKSRIYKGEGTFNFVCYEPFARGTIISKEEIYEAEPETIKIFLNKDYDGIVELPIDALEEIDNDEVQIYLSTDINNRGEWGLPTLDETGKKPARGQWDPYTEEASSNYYAYQPQKVILKQDLFGTNIELISDYQTYLYPIDLKHGFVGQIDAYSGITNGKLIDKTDPFYDYHMEKRQLEIVQYDPSLKVTYGPSTEDDKIKYTKYGVVQFIRNGTKIEVKTPTSVNFNITSSEDFSKYDSTKIYPKIIKTITRDQETQPKGAKEIYEDNEAKWDEEERQKYFIVEQADSVPYSGTKRSLFFQPNHNETHCKIEIKFKKDGEDHIINVDVDLLDAEHSVFKGNATEKGHLALSRSCSKMGNYQEWINFLNGDFPDTIPAWENGAMTIKNPGDLDMPFQVYYEFDDKGIISGDTISLDDNNSIQFSNIEKIGNDVGIIVDTYLRVIRGYTIDKDTLKKIPNENVYNRYITAGDFFYIPSGESILTSNGNPHIVYEYRYF